MTTQTLSTSTGFKSSSSNDVRLNSRTHRSRSRRTKESSDVLVSAVISSSLLTHLHHVLQRAEYGAVQDGRKHQATNFAQLRKVLCLDARSMEDASALGITDSHVQNQNAAKIKSKAA